MGQPYRVDGEQLSRAFTPPFGFVTSTSVEEFQHSALDSGELTQLYNECAFINAHGSGHGICRCGLGD